MYNYRLLYSVYYYIQYQSHFFALQRYELIDILQNKSRFIFHRRYSATVATVENITDKCQNKILYYIYMYIYNIKYNLRLCITRK